jgi:hypothetical protein
MSLEEEIYGMIATAQALKPLVSCSSYKCTDLLPHPRDAPMHHPELQSSFNHHAETKEMPKNPTQYSLMKIQDEV